MGLVFTSIGSVDQRSTGPSVLSSSTCADITAHTGPGCRLAPNWQYMALLVQYLYFCDRSPHWRLPCTLVIPSASFLLLATSHFHLFSSFKLPQKAHTSLTLEWPLWLRCWIALNEVEAEFAQDICRGHRHETIISNSSASWTVLSSSTAVPTLSTLILCMLMVFLILQFEYQVHELWWLLLWTMATWPTLFF